MPDISMCPSKDCPLRATCYRNEASGTKPTEYRQAWFCDAPGPEPSGGCGHYWPVDEAAAKAYKAKR